MRGPKPGHVLLLALVAAGAGAAAVGWQHPDRGRPGAPRPPPQPAAPAPATRPAARTPRPLFLHGPPLLRHRFEPRLSARAAILVDASDGRVLWAWRPHARLPIASTTKIMTALLVLERLEPRQLVSVSRRATRVPLVKEGLRPGERVQAWKLLDGLLVYSGNDDAAALAQAAAGSRRRFVGLMNRRAHELGLRDTHYTTPSGVVDRGNRSSAWDLAALTRYAMRDARFRRIVRTRIAHIRWSPPTFEKVYVNKNLLLGRYRGADGVKTGWTTLAGHCLVASAHRGGRRLIVVLLHSRNPYGEARRLLNFGFGLGSGT